MLSSLDTQQRVYGISVLVQQFPRSIGLSPSRWRSSCLSQPSRTIEVARSPNDGTALNVINQKIPISIKPEIYPALERRWPSVAGRDRFAGGDVYLQTGIYDLAANQSATFGIPLTSSSVSWRINPLRCRFARRLTQQYGGSANLWAVGRRRQSREGKRSIRVLETLAVDAETECPVSPRFP